MALDIRSGDRIGICSHNHAEWVVTQFATAKIGAILVNINPAYQVHELEYALNQSGCTALIIAPPFKTTDYAALLKELCPELSRGEPGQLCAARVPNLRTVIAFGQRHVPGTYAWEDVLERAAKVTPQELADLQCEQEFDHRSISNTRRARPAFPRAQRFHITRSSTTRSSLPIILASQSTTGCV
jgi:fatty-acyl-CoA synthase